MKNLASERLANAQGASVFASAAGRTVLILTAWVSTLLLSKLPLVIARDLLGADIPWITPAWIATAGLLIATTYAWPALKPLRGYFAIMGVILFVTTVLDPLARQTPVWQGFIANGSPLDDLFGDRVLLVLATLIVLAVLFLLGKNRREAFLTPGNLNAPVSGLTLPGKRRLSWLIFGTAISLLLAVLFFSFLASQNSLRIANLSAALPWLPFVLLIAAMNAFGEEGMYRAAPLAMLLPAVGARHAVWLTAIWFGLGHYYGGFPSGPIGLVYSGLLALLLGKAMLDTRGMGWPWIIHMVIDTVIYITVAAGMVVM